MIERKIKFIYYKNIKTGERCFEPWSKYDEYYDDDITLNDFWSKEAYDEAIKSASVNRREMWRGTKVQVSKFTNKGKLSKSEYKIFEKEEQNFIKEETEKKLASMLELEKSTKKDTERALELAKIINAANWDVEDKDLAVIKVKTSHSEWYQNVVNSPSEYLTLVPVSVAQEALELQGIRKKHQNDQTFDFFKTNYKTKEIRVADHENNYGSDGYLDNTTEDWTTIFNCSYTK